MAILEEQDLGSDRKADLALGDEPGRRRSDLDPLLPGTGAALPVALAVNDPAMGPDLDLQDLGGLGAKGRIGLVAGGSDPVGLRKIPNLFQDRKLRMECSPPARNPLPVTPGATFPGRLPDLRSLGPLLGFIAVEVLLEPPDLGLERFVFGPGHYEKLPVVPCLVFPVGGVLFRSARQISPRIRPMRAGPAGF